MKKTSVVILIFIMIFGNFLLAFRDGFSIDVLGDGWAFIPTPMGFFPPPFLGGETVPFADFGNFGDFGAWAAGPCGYGFNDFAWDDFDGSSGDWMGGGRARRSNLPWGNINPGIIGDVACFGVGVGYGYGPINNFPWGRR